MKFSAWKYNLPLVKPHQTATGSFKHRQGIILSLTSGTITALGEAAPLPGFSKETLSEIESKLTELRFEIRDLFRSYSPVQAMQSFFKEKDLPPSLEFGLDTLAYDFEAKQQNLPLHEQLFGYPSRPVPVNGLLSLQADKDFLSSVQKMVNDGYKTLKVKIGIDFDQEFNQLKKIRSSFPSLRIRADANRSWGVKEAIENLQALKTLNLEYCEEPVRKPSVENYRRLSRNTEVPLAIDETINRKENWQNLLPYISIVILKPAIIGSFTKNFATIALAGTHVNRIIITTSLESGIGRMVIAAVASGKGSENAAHGLSTGSLFKNDFWDDNLYIRKGNFYLTKEAGLKNIDNIDNKKFTINLL